MNFTAEDFFLPEMPLDLVSIKSVENVTADQKEERKCPFYQNNSEVLVFVTYFSKALSIFTFSLANFGD